jgi:tRNA U34 5-methylaminomethyl-2-thiouridine-forming methyltransferase MnmC
MSESRGGCEVVVTRAGEHSILDHLTGEVMHPVGRVESDSLYVAPSNLSARLMVPVSEPLVLLDVGLGMASNALAAFRVAHRLPSSARKLEIVSIDHSLEPLALALAPEHADAFGLTGSAGDAARWLLRSHAGPALASTLHRPEATYRDPRVTWSLLLSDLAEALASLSADSVDVVFWDIYSPRSLPQFWTEATFGALCRVCRHGATVHTYSGALAVRAAMLLGGFAVGLGPSSGGKQRHTTIAASDLCDLERPLGKAWLARLQQARVSQTVELSDSQYDRLAALPQFA